MSISSKTRANFSLSIRPETISPYHRLEHRLAIRDIGTHLYCHGIILFPGNEGKRSLAFHPYLILFLEVLYFGRSLTSLFVPLTNRQYFVYAGDYMFFIGAKTHINIAACQYMLTGISILLINIARYRLGNRPDFLKTYDFLAGRSPPARAGLRNPRYILALLLKARVQLSLTAFNTRLVGIVSFTMSILPLLINCTYTEVLLYGLPWSCIFAISSYHTFSSYYWNMAYFYILCHFIKFRLREASDAAQRAMQNPRSFHKMSVIKLHRQLQRISTQVEQYNATYWSSFLFIVVASLSTFNNTVLYAALFVDMHVVVQMSLFYANVLSCMAIFFLLNTAATVYHECNSSRIVLNSLYVNLQKTLSYRSLFKLNVIVDGLSGRIIGFYFLNLFIINYIRFFEISGMIIAYFLKITDLSRDNLL